MYFCNGVSSTKLNNSIKTRMWLKLIFRSSTCKYILIYSEPIKGITSRQSDDILIYIRSATRNDLHLDKTSHQA